MANAQPEGTKEDMKTQELPNQMTNNADMANYIQNDEGRPAFWRDWRWQLRHAVTDIDAFQELLGIEFDAEKRSEYEQTLERFPLSITPYYLSLIDTDSLEEDPIFRQSFPSVHELDVVDAVDMHDPLAEDADSPVPGLTHRYPDRVLLCVSHQCAMYCRHCTRKRKVGDVDSIPGREQLEKAIEYIRNTPQVRDVLLSGGDPFLLSDKYLDWILGELNAIEHVEVVRIGTRTPVVLPQRITPSLVNMLRKHQPVWVNTHFNHPREITASAKRALAMLVDAGIPMGNQSVLLAGVNDCPRIMKRLVHKLVQNRVRPYYIYQCDLSEGLSHFRTPVGKGIEIIESLIGHTSGFAVPTYVIDAPGGGGKIPVMPNYLISWSTNKVVLRNYEGVICTYKEPDSYEAIECDRKCEDCHLQLKLEGAGEEQATGIARLLDGHDSAESLVPAENERYARREDDPQPPDVPQDTVERLGSAVIQHGEHSNRVYLMKLDSMPSPDLPDRLLNLAHDKGYNKVFAKIPQTHFRDFATAGFHVEARVPGFYNGRDTGVFLAHYLGTDRCVPENPAKIDEVLRAAQARTPRETPPEMPTGHVCRRLNEKDAGALAAVYRTVFETYPFPIHDPAFLREAMEDDTMFFGVFDGESLVAAASAERDRDNANAEMTDFATLPEQRGKGLARILLARMEEEAAREGIQTFFTIARAVSFGMNITFADAGYYYAGTLINNTNIGGGIESMNVWYKPAPDGD